MIKTTPFWRRLTWSVLAGVIYSAPAWPEPPEGYSFLSYGEAVHQAQRGGKPLFLYFGREGCGVCRRMNAEVFSDGQVRELYHHNFVLAYVDTESGSRISLPSGERITEMQLSAQSRIVGTPTFVYFSDDQKPLIKTAGFKSIDVMVKLNEYVAGGHYLQSTFEQFTARQ